MGSEKEFQQLVTGLRRFINEPFSSLEAFLTEGRLVSDFKNRKMMPSKFQLRSSREEAEQSLGFITRDSFLSFANSFFHTNSVEVKITVSPNGRSGKAELLKLKEKLFGKPSN